ncbi:ROK family protein [Alishewanella longhuensis]
MSWCYGLDIGGSKIELAIFDPQLQVQQRWRVATPTQDLPAFIKVVSAQIARADALCGQDAKVGIALPGVIRADGTVISSNVPCLTDQPVAALLTQQLARTVVIGNDCRCFALSEAVAGAGKGYRKVLGYILGTGAGGGFCLDGQLLPGRVAGEYGHIAISALVAQRHQLPLRQCGCGLLGCVEPYISGTGLGRLYQHYTAKAASSVDWVNAYRQQDTLAQQTFEVYLDILGAHLAGLCLTLEPDCLVLGGGLSQIPELIAALPAAIQDHLFAGVTAPLVLAAEGGDASGVRGAAILAQFKQE